MYCKDTEEKGDLEGLTGEVAFTLDLNTWDKLFKLENRGKDIPG